MKKLIEGKRVCFVGASPILIDKGEAEKIDSYDIVVRTNGSLFLLGDPKFTKHYGSKIDILYTNHQFYREMKPLPLGLMRQLGVKAICMKTCGPADYLDYNKLFICRVIKDTMVKVNQTCKSATMGAYIYTDLLQYNPAELYITGVDFFASKSKVFRHNDYREYFPGYLPDKIRKQGNKINAGKKEDGHNFQDNAYYIWNLFHDNTNMVFPNYIFGLLKDIMQGEVEQK